MLGNLIFIIILVAFISKNVKQSKDGGTKTGHTAGGTQDRQQRSQAAGTGKSAGWGKMPGQAAGKISAQTAAAKKAAAGLTGRTGKSLKKEEISTTEYLRKKAMEDAAEHAREKQQEAARLYRDTGGRSVAERLVYGDSLPQGKEMVKCSYCGAENLIPVRKNRKDYTCYFCREIL